MSLLSVKNITCTQSLKTLFKNATFTIEEQDKIAVVGPNGCGKTTLLSLLANDKDIASTSQPGTSIAIKKGLRISYLVQTLKFEPEDTLQDHVFNSKSSAAKAIQAYQKSLVNYQENTGEKTEEALTQATETMDHLNAWAYEDRVRSILKELNIQDFSQKMRDLSGGMLKKIALAQVFFDQADLLILDEPTNHLDVTTIEWLEGMLHRYPSAILMVTHDRYFLDKICTKLFEIDQQKFFVYKGNYQTYLEQRDQRYATQGKQEQRIQSILKVELAWLKQGPKARSTKQRARKERIETMRNRDVATSEKMKEFSVDDRRLGKKVCELKHISKSFDDKQIIDDFSYAFKQGERIGILGPNGAGKTTLLNLIMSKRDPDSGEVDVGVNTVFGYFDQHSQDFDLEMTIYEHMNQIGSQIKCQGGTILSISKLLEQFLFPGSMLKTPIGKLSGGEQRRLHLVCLLLKNPNFLLLDEPTNDLDIQTLSVLENFLISFSGCVIIISHDRYFMDRVVDRLFVFKANGKIASFQGNYTEYSDTLKTKNTVQTQVPSTKSDKTLSSNKQEPKHKLTNKLTNKEREELKKIEKEIDRLETEKAQLSKLFSGDKQSKDVYADAGKQLKIISEELDQKLERWEEFADRL